MRYNLLRIKKVATRTILVASGVLFVCFLFFGVIIAFWISSLKIPDTASLDDLKIIQSTKIYDRSGKITLWDIHEDVQRTVVPLKKISRHIKNATIATEDSSFYQHQGIDWSGLIRAALVNIRLGRVRQGGSTITQQLIKNTFLTTDRTFTRKIKEIILTLKIEKKLSKDQILELYLNEIPYGGSNYGVEAASRNFFSKTSADLNLAEAAYLASLPKAPTYYSPYGNNRDKLEQRKNTVLTKMAELGFVSAEESETAKSTKVIFINKGQNSIKAPHFSAYIRSYLEDKYGKDVVEQGGLKVITTLDYALQQKAEGIVARYAKENKEKFNASNAGMVAIDPKTGQILAMVGSKDYFNKNDLGNFNVTTAKRQPGSAIKPFIYAAALQKGFTPETIVFDLPTEFNPSCAYKYEPTATTSSSSSSNKDEEHCYMPSNYDQISRGPVSFRNALAQSLNVPSVKVLYLTGIKNALNLIRDFGITSLNDPNRYGLTLVLGGGEVSLLELTGAYSVLANNGIRNQITSILKVEDRNGNTLEAHKNEPKPVLDKNIALSISDILSDDAARAPVFGSRTPLYFTERPVAAKTGTTNDYKDAWVVGYTPNVVLGAWVGNNNNTPMEKKVAGFIVTPMWHEFMKEIFKEIPREDFEKPLKTKSDRPILSGQWLGEETYLVDKISGKLATEFTPPEMIQKKILTQVHSILYWINKDQPNSGKPSDPESDPQFKMWEIPVIKWAAENNLPNQTEADIPKETDDIHKPEYAPVLKTESPQKYQQYHLNSDIVIKFTAESKFEPGQADFFFNNKYLGSLNQAPYIFSFRPGETTSTTSEAEIKIIVYDKIKNKSETIIPITIN